MYNRFLFILLLSLITVNSYSQETTCLKNSFRIREDTTLHVYFQINVSLEQERLVYSSTKNFRLANPTMKAERYDIWYVIVENDKHELLRITPKYEVATVYFYHPDTISTVRVYHRIDGFYYRVKEAYTITNNLISLL